MSLIIKKKPKKSVFCSYGKYLALNTFSTSAHTQCPMTNISTTGLIQSTLKTS